MSTIVSIGTAVPSFEGRQSTILKFMQQDYDNESASRKLNILFHHSGISKRYSVVPDFIDGAGVKSLFHSDHRTPMVEERLKLFKKEAVTLSLLAVQNAMDQLGTTISDFGFTHLITVTCTGIYSPGIDSDLVEQLDLPNDIFRTAINFVGCNAAFHALKVSDYIARTDGDARILILCVELCTIHYQPKDNNDNLLSNTIFGDGAAAIIVTSDAFGKFPNKGLAINGFYSRLCSNGKSLMGWDVTPVNFEMILDSSIPDFIGNEINDLLKCALKKYRIKSKKMHWAIHPGGKKILDVVKKRLLLPDAELISSYKILDEYGNMSSPTILFVMKEILKTRIKPGENIFAMGFGPGLTIDTALFTYVG